MSDSRVPGSLFTSAVGARWGSMVVAGALTLSLVQLGAPSASAASPPVTSAPVAPAKVVAPKPVPVSSRADSVSAAVAARAQGFRVEAESERSATSTTWANPDGTWTTEQHAGPIRFRDSDGSWRDVDLTLAEQADGSVAPKGHPGKLRLKGASKTASLAAPTTTENDVVSADESKDGTVGVSLAWAGTLGAPRLAGNRATYAEVQPGVDLVVDVLRTGYEQSMVIKTPAALAGLSAGGADVSWSLPAKTRGLTARAEADGSISFVDAKNVVASRLAAPVAWDAVVDPRSGEHASMAPVKLGVAQNGSGKAVVTMTPDQGWLSDPARVFPITIDPTYASANVTTSFDTYVSSQFPTATYSSATELRVGTYNYGADKYRSFLTFPLASIKDKVIISASLSLYEFHSWSCTARPFYLYSANGASDTTNWSNQPAAVTSYGSLNTAKGWSSACAAGRVSVPVTGLADAWSRSTSAAGAIRLHADETDNFGWKKFYSLESTQDPYLSFTYNRPPNTPGTPTHTPGVSSNAPTAGWTSTTTPTLKATVSDPDGGTVKALFSVYLNGNGTPVINKAAGSAVASGGTSVYTVPAGKLANGSSYVVRAYGNDGTLTSAAWSTGYDRFVVDTTIPNPPTVSSTTWTAGAWTPATSGTISWSDTSPDATLFSWKLDTGPWSAFGAARSQALTGLAKDREHTFSVKASDVSGHVSAVTDFTFGVGVQATSSGSRAASQPVTHQLSDSAKLSLNPTNGNVALTGSLLRLRGVGQDLNIGWRYNGLVDARPTLNVGLTETALVPWSDGSFSYVAPDGGAYTFTKSGSTWVTPAGINATLTSPAAGTMKLRFNPSGIVNTYVNTAGVFQLTGSADKNTTSPNLVSYTYTGGKLTSITDTQGRLVTFAYTDAGNPTQPSSITDTSLPRTITLAYGGSGGALSQITDASGAVSTLAYDATGLVSLTINGNQSTFGYDPTGRLTGWTFGVGSPEASNWAASYVGALTTVTDGNSHAAVYTITGITTTKITDPLMHDTTSVWDGHDNLTSRTDANSNTSSNSYGNATNPNNLLATITSPAGTTGGTGASQSLTFPTAATGGLGDYQPTGTTDAQGNTAAIGYDTNTGQANSVSSKSAAGVAIGGTKTVTIQGDGAGTNCGAKTGEVCTTSNGNNNITTYGYDGAGNPTSITPPAPLGARAFTYDPAGRVLTSTDGRGNTARYSYDANGRTTEVSQAATGCPAATCVAYTYDAAGNLTSRSSPTGVTSFGYDALNRPTTKTQAGVLVSTATYDPASNLTSYTDATGTIGYGYDSANRLVSLAEPGGSCPAYPATAATPNATACTVFTYDNANRRIGVKYPNGQSIINDYDNANRVRSITATATGGAVLASRAYTYQSAALTLGDQALRASMTDQSGTTTYFYDGLNRLTSATKAGIASGWTYDNDGNRTTATKTGTPTLYSVYNGADQLCWSSTTSGTGCASPPAGATTYAYDATGNQTSDQLAGGPALANTFNVFNQLTDTLVGGATTLTSTYADTGNTERLTAGATSFINGTLGITSQTTNGTAVNYIRDPSGNLVAMRTAGQSYYYTSDAQGSVIALTDSTQALAAAYTYDPWGNTTTKTGPLAATNPWTYATGYTDPTTGYLKLGARYYNPTTGRFTQPDPSGQEANGYAYAGDNPTNRTDPTGLWWSVGDWGAAIGLGFGIAGMTVFLGPEVVGIGAAMIAIGSFETALGFATYQFGCDVTGCN